MIVFESRYQRVFGRNGDLASRVGHHAQIVGERIAFRRRKEGDAVRGNAHCGHLLETRRKLFGFLRLVAEKILVLVRGRIKARK